MNSELTPPVSVDELRDRGLAVACPHGLWVRAPRGGRTLLIAALTDLDGTANDEHVPEHGRLATLGPARAALATLADSGIVTGICTARSFGEARQYREALGGRGPLIAENGAVLGLPDGTRRVFGNAAQLGIAVRRIGDRLGRPVPSSLDWPSLEAAWERERAGAGPVFLGHPDRESLRLAGDRVASCFLVGLSAGEKAVARTVAAELGLDCFGELLHLIPQGADKGRALAALGDHLRSADLGLPGPVDLVAHIVFGNGENDLPLFARAIDGGGAAVLVGDATSENGFHFDPALHPVPAGTITLPGVSHGHGMVRSLPRVAEQFARDHGIRFPWSDPD